MTTLNFDDYVLEIHPISPLVQQSIEGQYIKKHPEPVRPTYQVEAVGGVIETFVHDETTVETPEEKETFAQWKMDHSQWQAGLIHKTVRMFLLRGVSLRLTPQQEADLNHELSLLDFDIPENKKERELLYLETFIVDTQQKLETIMQAVLAETGIKKEALEQAENLFQN
jgi:hypothetical protein